MLIYIGSYAICCLMTVILFESEIVPFSGVSKSGKDYISQARGAGGLQQAGGGERQSSLADANVTLQLSDIFMGICKFSR